MRASSRGIRCNSTVSFLVRFGVLVGVFGVQSTLSLRGSAPILANSFEGSGQLERGKVEVGAEGMVWVTAVASADDWGVGTTSCGGRERGNTPTTSGECAPSLTAHHCRHGDKPEGWTGANMVDSRLRVETRVWLCRRKRQLLLLNDRMCCRKFGLLSDPKCGSNGSGGEFSSVGTMGSSCNNHKRLCPDTTYAHAANCTQLTRGSLEPQDSRQAEWWAQSGKVALRDELWSSPSSNDKDIECQTSEVEFGAGVNQSMLCDACQVNCYSYARSCFIIFPPVVIGALPLAAYDTATLVVRGRSSSMLGRVCVVYLFCMTQTQYTHKHTHTHTLSLSHTHTHTHTYTQTHAHKRIHAYTHKQLGRASEGIADESGVWLAWLCGGESARTCETECGIPYKSATARHCVMEEQGWERIQDSRREDQKVIEGEREQKWRCMLIERVLAFRAGVCSQSGSSTALCVCCSGVETRCHAGGGFSHIVLLLILVP